MNGTIITFGKYNGYNTLDLLQSTAGQQYLGWGAENLSSPKWRQAFQDALNAKEENMADFREGRFVENISYYLMFERIQDSAMFYVPCNENGAPLNRDDKDYARCTGANADKFYSYDVQTQDNSYWTPASVRCSCGTWVTLDDSWTNDCHNCHQAYNGSGSKLVHHSLWGEGDN